MADPAAFEIRYRAGTGDGSDPVELVGPHIRPVRFESVGAAYHYWKRCFAPLCDAPLIVHTIRLDGVEYATMRV